jgi:two-component system sensor histidine kinase KdpD
VSERPHPDALLRRLRSEEGHRRRGRLKVLFGASPGVGKTYAMLEGARKARSEGIDVVAGWVETHGRVETEALMEGLESIPAREVEYRGVRLREFDLDAALGRRPKLLLLDELAHTNAAGSRHAKRWQDARELIDAGIDVHTTLNVQHLESLNDVVTQVTGVTVRETVPDQVLDQADEVEFVDLPPEDLLKRLAEGKVYVADQAARATQHFFRKGNLMALRELALRSTADRVDAAIQDYRRDHAIGRTWPVAERILVCIRPHPESPRLVRAARRMATRLRADWIVVSVESPSQPRLSPDERESLAGTLKLAEELGAETAVLSGESVSGTLLAYARERNVSTIVVGKPTHSRWRDRLRGSLHDDIVRDSGEISAYFIAGEGDERAAPRPAALRRRSPPGSYLWAAGVAAACTLVCAAMFHRFDKSNLIMVYLLGVAFVASRHGRGPSALAACLSVALFDFFFVPPHLTFAVADTQYVITFAVMLVVGLLISRLAVRVRDQAEAAQRREQRTQVLYSLSRELAGLHAPEEIARITCRHFADSFHGPAGMLLPDANERLVAQPSTDAAFLSGAHEAAVAKWVFEQGRSAGLGTETLPGAAALYVPLRSGDRALGVLGLQPAPNLLPLTPEHSGLLEALANQAAASLERARLSGESEQARLAVERERLRSTLLSSVSHDFRTPLAAITGAVTCLLEDASLGAAAKRDLEETIYEESERLNRLVTNLLDMTRLEAGSVELRRDWHSLEEVVGSALARLERRLGQRPVETAITADLPLVRIDAGLVEQVLVNLLENAVKYTPPDCRIRIQAVRGDGEVLVTVTNDGPWLPAGEEERIFEKFYRASSSIEGGFGLGLPICRAIVNAHGGRIWAENLTPRGVAFHFTLPAQAEPPGPMASEPENLPAA